MNTATTPICLHPEGSTPSAHSFAARGAPAMLPMEPPLAAPWDEAEQTVAAHQREEAAAQARADAEARAREEAERVRFGRD